MLVVQIHFECEQFVNHIGPNTLEKFPTLNTEQPQIPRSRRIPRVNEEARTDTINHWHKNGIFVDMTPYIVYKLDDTSWKNLFLQSNYEELVLWRSIDRCSANIYEDILFVCLLVYFWLNKSCFGISIAVGISAPNDFSIRINDVCINTCLALPSHNNSVEKTRATRE